LVLFGSNVGHQPTYYFLEALAVSLVENTSESLAILQPLKMHQIRRQVVLHKLHIVSYWEAIPVGGLFFEV
jgi:hypothetical protein